MPIREAQTNSQRQQQASYVYCTKQEHPAAVLMQLPVNLADPSHASHSRPLNLGHGCTVVRTPGVAGSWASPVMDGRGRVAGVVGGDGLVKAHPARLVTQQVLVLAVRRHEAHPHRPCAQASASGQRCGMWTYILQSTPHLVR